MLLHAEVSLVPRLVDGEHGGSRFDPRDPAVGLWRGLLAGGVVAVVGGGLGGGRRDVTEELVEVLAADGQVGGLDHADDGSGRR